jgi:dTDP-4-amino-4,6-dideoxygalactose transaminase
MNLTYTTSRTEIQGEKPKKYPAKLSPVLAIFGYHQLCQLQKINNIKQQITYSYFETFKDFVDLDIYYKPQTIGVRFPVVFKSYVSVETIQKIKIAAAKQGFTLGEWFNSVIHPKGSFQYFYKSGSCPVGEQISERIVNFPININRIPSEAEFLILKTIFIHHGIH